MQAHDDASEIERSTSTPSAAGSDAGMPGGTSSDEPTGAPWYMEQVTALMRLGPSSAQGEFIRKLEPEHISTVLKNADKGHEREVEARQSRDAKVLYSIIAFMVFFLVVIFLLLYYKETHTSTRSLRPC
jgi:hypothetical protein